MKNYFLKKIRKEIIKQYPKYSKDKVDEIMYGVEGIYLTITKTIIISLIALILGVFKELIFLLISFNFIRLFAFGMHANKSWICLLFSSTLFLGGAYLCKILIIPKNILITLFLIVVLIISIYAPSDTVKRPLIKKKRRIIFKILSITVVIIYFILTLIIKNNLFINAIIIGLIIECILILPTTYMIFKMPYKNYKSYGLNT